MLYNQLKLSKIVKTNQCNYYNIPVSFDIETSSWYNGEEKHANMYIWSFDLNGLCFYGRTWLEYVDLINRLVEIFNLSDNLHLVVYVQNLAYEFQFIRKWFEWKNVFARELRKPMKAIDNNGLEYRCSYMLSRYSLDKIASNLSSHNIKKLKGDLDYRLIRHTQTPLSDEELGYCLNDVKIVEYFILEEIERNGDISKIPLTQTGYVRRDCRNNCVYTEKHRRNEKFCKLIKSLCVDNDEFKQLQRAFQGGFTHANAMYVGQIIPDVGSYDFTSSYPYVMCSEKFPMSASHKIDIKSREMFEYYCKNYGCVFDIEFVNIESKVMFEHIISLSKCIKINDYVVDNGRIISANYLLTTITNLDFESISKFYSWDRYAVHNFRYYEMEYLPTEFVDVVLTLYEDKTKLKDVEDKKVEYLHAKEKVNACYGMMVTNIAPDEIHYTESWEKDSCNLIEQINKYNKKINRFLYYPWGIWVTAYARRNLFTGILAFGNDYVYSDTDSVKGKNIENHQNYIDSYNRMCRKKLERAMHHHNFNIERAMPKTIDGVSKMLGVWDFDGKYKLFKTLGAKRYLCYDGTKYMLTVSGLNKETTVPYLVSLAKQLNKNVFDLFDNGMSIPSEHTGKLTHTYIDFAQHGTIIDYLGNEGVYDELSSVHLEPASYDMTLSHEYIEFLKEIYFKNVQEKT